VDILEDLRIATFEFPNPLRDLSVINDLFLHSYIDVFIRNPKTIFSLDIYLISGLGADRAAEISKILTEQIKIN